MTELVWRYLEEAEGFEIDAEDELRGVVADLWPATEQAVRELAGGWLEVKCAEEDEADRSALVAAGRKYDPSGLLNCCLPLMRQVLGAGLRAIGQPAVEFLHLRFAESGDLVERAGVALLLAEFGDAAAVSVPLLAAEVADPVDREGRHLLRCAAATALGEIDVPSAEVVGALTRVAGDGAEPQPLRAYCVEALMDLGPAAAASIPVLEGIFRDDGEGEDLRMFAWSALKSVGAESREHGCGGTVAEHMRSLYRSEWAPETNDTKGEGL
jgi:hypothetical protein